MQVIFINGCLVLGFVCCFTSGLLALFALPNWIDKLDEEEVKQVLVGFSSTLFILLAALFIYAIVVSIRRRNSSEKATDMHGDDSGQRSVTQPNPLQVQTISTSDINNQSILTVVTIDANQRALVPLGAVYREGHDENGQGGTQGHQILREGDASWNPEPGSEVPPESGHPESNIGPEPEGHSDPDGPNNNDRTKKSLDGIKEERALAVNISFRSPAIEASEYETLSEGSSALERSASLTNCEEQLEAEKSGLAEVITVHEPRQSASSSGHKQQPREEKHHVTKVSSLVNLFERDKLLLKPALP